jgi:hypothetical protein
MSVATGMALKSYPVVKKKKKFTYIYISKRWIQVFFLCLRKNYSQEEEIDLGSDIWTR